MAEFELKVIDKEDGELEVIFNAENLGKMEDMNTNTATQNLAIMLFREMAKVGITIPEDTV